MRRGQQDSQVRKVTIVMRDNQIWHVEVPDEVSYKEILDGKREFLPAVKEGKELLINKAMILAIREKDHYVA